MPPLPFPEYAKSEGSSFGLPSELLERVQRESEGGADCGTLLGDEQLRAAGLEPEHLLGLRRTVWRYRALCRFAEKAPDEGVVRSRLAVQAKRWAHRLVPEDDPRRAALAGALAATATATLNRGRLRMRLKRPGDPRTADLGELAEHTEGCGDIPPHRWFKARRAVADGLLWIEVLPPEGEAKRALGSLESSALVDQLERAVAKPVLDAIGERAEREAISTAAEAVRDLFSRPRLGSTVAGVALDRKRLWATVLGGEHDGDHGEFDARSADRLAAWLEARGVEHVGLSRLDAKGSPVGLIRALAQRNLVVEPVSEVGLMKQANKCAGPLKRCAAEVVARRLRDPVEGYADLEPDELGLGEYLDMVDGERLRAALTDARDVAVWIRSRKAQAPGVVAGLVTSPMVKGLSDLRPGMELGGTVVNLTHFGAFVEMGLEVQGLVHLSELADRFVKHPSEVVRVGQRVRVRVLQLDRASGRLSLTMRSGRDAQRSRSRATRSDALKSLDDLFKT